jgi:NADH dehydrogenase
VTLVDRLASHLWKPLLHEVAAGRMDADVHDVDYVLMAYWHHFRFRQGAVIGLDRARRELELDRVCDEEGTEILPQRARALRHADLLRRQRQQRLRNARVSPSVRIRSTPPMTPSASIGGCSPRAFVRRACRARRIAAVDIVIIGAGATGVELAAEIRHCTKAHASYGLENLVPDRDIHLTLIEAAPRVLPPLSEPIAAAATDLLAKLDVAVRTGERVTAIDESGVRTASGALHHADLVVWAAGIQAPSWLADLDGLEVNRAHQLVVDTTLVTTRDPNIFALGDCAACPWPEAGREGAILPPRAQVARQQASLLVKSIGARLAGRALPAFHFHDFGSLVSLGELSAVGSLMGRLIGGSLLVQGLIARWMYVSLYKMHQVSIHGYLRVALDTFSRIVRHRLEPRVKLH